MADNSKIEWTDATWNPVTGCTKVSQGCKHCYAERIFARPYPGRKFTDVRTHPERLEQPLKWRKPRHIFVNSMSDLFHERIPDEFIDEVFAVMGACEDQGRGHVFEILTKRPERMRDYMRSRGHAGWNRRRLGQEAYPPRNVWLGVSVENQETADERIPLLLQTPAKVRFLSCEPLIGPIEIRGHLESCGDCDPCIGGCPESCAVGSYYTGALHPDGVHWVIAGSESGPKARPCDLEWVRSLRDQCIAAAVPFFWKQHAEKGRKISTPELDGKRWVEFPD